jgi:hypothetical protein
VSSEAQDPFELVLRIDDAQHNNAYEDHFQPVGRDRSV